MTFFNASSFLLKDPNCPKQVLILQKIPLFYLLEVHIQSNQRGAYGAKPFKLLWKRAWPGAPIIQSIAQSLPNIGQAIA